MLPKCSHSVAGGDLRERVSESPRQKPQSSENLISTETSLNESVRPAHTPGEGITQGCESQPAGIMRAILEAAYLPYVACTQFCILLISSFYQLTFCFATFFI